LSIGIDLERFEHFKDAEFRSAEIISATHIKLTFGVQDKARAYDWITMVFDFHGVSDAKLIEDTKIDFIDMSDGISILKDRLFSFAIGEYNNITNINDSIFYIKADDIKYTQGQF
jgi:hypothetical protein